MTCGDFGGVTVKGEPCRRAAGWGVPDTDDGRCKTHLDQEPAPAPTEPVTYTAAAGHYFRVDVLGTLDAALHVTLTPYPVPAKPPAPAALARVGWAVLETGQRREPASVEMTATWRRP